MNIYDKSYISQKAVKSKFNRDTYEKVLRLIDVLEFINQDEFLKNKLALKGGTAINLLEFDLPRLSVDIDLDYTINSDIDQMKMDRERITNRILTFMHRQGYIKKRDNRQSFITDSYYFNYINTGGNSDHIKVDINYVMRAHIYEPKPRMLVTDEFEIDGGVNALNSIEIYGSKINALNNRAAVRDLYDIWKYVAEDRAYNSFEQLKKAVIFYHVLTSESITGNFSLLATNKLNQHSILRELVPVLKKGELFILDDALIGVKKFIDELMCMTDDELKFIESFKSGEYLPELLFDDNDIIKRLEKHPMAKWKTEKIKQKQL